MKISSTKINKYITSDKYDFKRFKMHYSSKEILSIDTFNINKFAHFSHFGSYKDLKNINEFLSTLGDNNKILVNIMEKIIYNITKKVLKGYNMEHFWMDIRVSIPNNDYDIPRWHKDGNFFPNERYDEKNTSKFVTVMKGPGTLLIKGTKRINKIYNKNFRQEMSELTPDSPIAKSVEVADKYRAILAKKLSKEPVVQVKNNEALIFFTGVTKKGVPIQEVDWSTGALHSEPKIDAPRMFISILPSTEDNIMALKKRWNR